MARGINKVIIVGNLGRDPETRYLPSGGAVTNVSVATSKAWRDRDSGEQKERTEWHRVVFFNRLAEIASEYLKRGSKIYLEGELRTGVSFDASKVIFSLPFKDITAASNFFSSSLVLNNCSLYFSLSAFDVISDKIPCSKFFALLFVLVNILVYFS